MESWISLLVLSGKQPNLSTFEMRGRLHRRTKPPVGEGGAAERLVGPWGVRGTADIWLE